MKKNLQKLYQKKDIIYRIFLIAVVSSVILYFFPRGTTFKYDFQKGKPWMYENLYAPFDFPIYKTVDELKKERSEISNSIVPYFNYEQQVVDVVKENFTLSFDSICNKNKKQCKTIYKKGMLFLDSIYSNGVIVSDKYLKNYESVNLFREGNRASRVTSEKIFKLEDLKSSITIFFEPEYALKIYELLFNIVEPNLTENKGLKNRFLDEELSNISLTRGQVDKGTRIIMRGEVVEGDKFKELTSLKKEFNSQTWDESNYVWPMMGYSILILIIVSLLIFYLKKYFRSLYDNNNKITFICFNVVTIIGLTSLVTSYGSDYIYTIPVCILPLTLNAFFKTSIAFFVHLITLFLLGFIVPDSFQFLFIQTVVAILIFIAKIDIYKRANLFSIVLQVVLTYVLLYLSFIFIQEGNNYTEYLSLKDFSMFLINGLAILFVLPLIYIYEKVFSLLSDISLLELSDTNSFLLKELAEKAPGTFNHSLQVANLAEAASNEVGADSLLVRVGAFYHDIGKLSAPSYFTENQMSSVSLHDDLSPRESSKIIINHIIYGIELAKKHKLPDVVIDFIRTHHGTTLTRYFYIQEKQNNPDVNPKDFQYSGPIPFSKETAILMMADSIEAGTKSLKNPTQIALDEFVERIINFQISEGQFLNSDITLKEIEVIKKIFKNKLINIYNLRIEYPE